MGLLDYFDSINRNHIYVAVMIITILPLVIPQLRVGGIEITDMARGYTAELDKLEAGDIVLIQCAFSAMHFPEIQAAAIDTFQEIISVGAKFVLFTMFGTETLILEAVVFPYIEDLGAVYGEDYMSFGYMPASGPALASFASDPRRLVGVDHYGNSLEDLPMIKAIFDNMADTGEKFMNSMDLIIGFGLYFAWYIFVWTLPYRVPTITAATTMFAALIIPYYSPFMLKGILQGPLGNAQYELIRGKTGLAGAQTSAMSLVVLLWVVLLVIGNISMVRKRLKGGT